MKKYQGKISGVGNAITRQNEITADDLAISRNYIYGWEYGVINRSGWNFNAYKDGNNVVVEKGIMFAYGYFGILPESVTIPFIKSSATQYRFIYAEIDRSVVPNTFLIKVKNNQGSDKIKPTTFRQDYLTAVRTGVFQLPLWRIELNSEGISKIVDVRDLRDYIKQVNLSNSTTGIVTGEISLGALASNQLTTSNSEKLATTDFVRRATRKYIDNKEPPGIVVKVEIVGAVNYVIWFTGADWEAPKSFISDSDLEFEGAEKFEIKGTDTETGVKYFIRLTSAPTRNMLYRITAKNLS